MIQKLHMALTFSNLVASNIKLYNQIMCNLYAKYVKILEICKHFSGNLVNEKGNVSRRGVVPKFSDLEVVALTLAAETESIDSENWLFCKLNQSRHLFPNLISRRLYNYRRKSLCGLMEEICKKIPESIDGFEDYLCVDSKPIEVCRPSRGQPFVVFKI